MILVQEAMSTVRIQVQVGICSLPNLLPQHPRVLGRHKKVVAAVRDEDRYLDLMQSVVAPFIAMLVSKPALD